MLNPMKKAGYIILLLAVVAPLGIASAQASTPKSLKKIEFTKVVDSASREWAFVQREFPPSSNPNQMVSLATVDLNGDGILEHAFYVSGSASCGGGNCDLAIYKGGRSKRRLIFEAATGPLIYVLKSRAAGYHDIGIPRTDFSSSKRTHPYVILSWDKHSYHWKE